MVSQSTRRWLPGRRGWLLLAASAVVIGGTATVSLCSPRIRQLVASNIPAWAGGQHASEAASHDGHDDEDGHAHPAPQGCQHSHEGEAPCPQAAEAPAGDHDAHGDEAGCEAGAHDGHAADGDDHQHDEAEAVKLSANAQANVGLKMAKVELRPFERTIAVPAMVVERPGRSTVQVAAPLTGVVTRIWPLQGETVTPGQPLFDLRLTHEEVVEAQAEFLRTAEELDVLGREIARLEKVSADGAVAGKTLLERTYERQKLDAVFRAQRQRLLLHGLSPAQVDEIAANRTLLSGLTVAAPEQIDEPPRADGAGQAAQPRLLQIEELKVTTGQHVKAGDPLCVLADHARLYIQGKAFEQDAAALEKAAANDWRATAVVAGSGQERQMVPDLPIVYLANKIEAASRAFPFYVELSNRVVRNRETPDGHRFSSWQFRPGQRVELLVPVERWADRIVLPLAAVVQDGPESFVFERNDGHFDRRAVRVEYRDRYSAVIANDGALALGKSVIVSGAYQVHLAMKNKAGGAPDPHAGHNH